MLGSGFGSHCKRQVDDLCVEAGSAGEYNRREVRRGRIDRSRAFAQLPPEIVAWSLRGEQDAFPALRVFLSCESARDGNSRG